MDGRTINTEPHHIQKRNGNVKLSYYLTHTMSHILLNGMSKTIYNRSLLFKAWWSKKSNTRNAEMDRGRVFCLFNLIYI